MTAIAEQAVRERPILFSGEMVRAILDRRKSQTRRVVKPQPNADDLNAPYPNERSHITFLDLVEKPDYYASCGYSPYGAVGGRLWVRETWASLVFEHDFETGYVDGWHPAANPKHGTLVYDAEPHGFNDGGNSVEERGFAWRPSIFMPRWASRITLEITGIRLERLQEISEGDAIAEGCFDEEQHDGELPRQIYSELWNCLNASRGYGWNANPWVWVIEFRRASPPSDTERGERA